MTTVRKILGCKEPRIVTIAGDATTLAAAKLMTEHKIGAVVIIGADRKPIGIFTERDFLRLIATGTEAPLQKTMAEVMTKRPITCRVDDNIVLIEQTMSNRRFRHMPVVDNDGALIGVVSSGDITKIHVDTARDEAGAMREYIRTA